MENSKKENKEKEREVYAIGRPSFENLSKDEQKAFFLTLLHCVVDYYKDKPKNSWKLFGGMAEIWLFPKKMIQYIMPTRIVSFRRQISQQIYFWLKYHNQR